VALVTLAVLPLCFLDQSRLAFSSALGIIANLYALGLIFRLFAQGGGAPAAGCCLFDLGPGGVALLSVLMQASAVQACVLPMYEALERRTPARFAGCLTAGWGFAFLLFAAFSTVAYLRFGPSVSSNVLDELPGTLEGDLARIGMAVSAIVVYPILLSAMVAPIAHSEQRALTRGRSFHIPSPLSAPRTSPVPSPQTPLLAESGLPEESTWKIEFTLEDLPGHVDETTSTSSGGSAKEDAATRPGKGDCAPSSADFCLTNSVDMELAANGGLRLDGYWPRPSTLATWVIVLASALGAMRSTSLGAVNVVAGALSIIGTVAVAPGLVGIYLVGWKGRLWWWSMVVLIGLGSVATVLELMMTRRHVSQVERTCLWMAATVSASS